MGDSARNTAVEQYATAVLASKHQDIWRESLLISRSITHTSWSRPSLPGKPDYFECFQGYASHLLDSSSRLVRNINQRQTLEQLYAIYSKLPFMDTLLSQQLLAELHVSIQEQPLTVAQVIHSAIQNAKSTITPEVMMRHIMWLLKQGMCFLLDAES